MIQIPVLKAYLKNIKIHELNWKVEIDNAEIVKKNTERNGFHHGIVERIKR